jgi:LacI family transcriptional regulator
MSRAAVDLLVRHIKGRRTQSEDGPPHMLLDYELVRRQSDAAPRLRPKHKGRK